MLWQSVKEILGLPMNDAIVAELKRKLHRRPVIVEYETATYYLFKSKGLAFLGNKDTGLVSSVFLYAEGKEGYKQYQGEMPASLSFALGRIETRSLLGSPIKSAESNYFALLNKYVHS